MRLTINAFINALSTIALLLVFTFHAKADQTWNFNTNDGGFASASESGDPTNLFTYSGTIGIGGSGGWFINGAEMSSIKTLTSPAATVTANGAVTFSMAHRFNFEYGDGNAFDGGQLRISVNGGAFTLVPAASFTANGYTPDIDGVDGLGLQPGWSNLSPDFPTVFITSTANLGTFNAGDTIRIQFRAGWDTSVANSSPNWVIDDVTLTNVNPLPTAALVSITGRVTTSSGKGISRALVSVTNESGVTRSAITNIFGYFRLEEVESGQTYVFSVRSKRYQFNPQVVYVTEQLEGLDFVALP